MDTKVCVDCGEEKSRSEFYKLSRRSGTEVTPRCKVCERARLKRRREETRLAIVTHYSSGRMCCADCGEDRYPVLDLDHINGGGRAERTQAGSPEAFYTNLIKTGFPEGYRVLCRNCNWMAFVDAKAV